MPEINRLFQTAAAPTTAAGESIVATFPLNANTHPLGLNEVRGVLAYTAGTGTTAVVVRVRQGTTVGGALVGNAVTHTLAAGASASIPFGVEDAASPVGNQYVVTVQQTGGTGAGSCTQAQGEIYNVAGVSS